MAISLSDNIYINSGKPSEAKSLRSDYTPYASVTEANNSIPLSFRYRGLTVVINDGSGDKKYWYKDGVANGNLVEFSAGSSFTFSNGLTESGGVVKIGGAINESTLITTNSSFTIGGIGTKAYIAWIGGSVISDSANFLNGWSLDNTGFKVKSNNNTILFPNAAGTVALTSDIVVVNATNGLTKAFNDIKLGGTLSENTTINTSALDFNLKNVQNIGLEINSWNIRLKNGTNTSYVSVNDNQNVQVVAQSELQLIGNTGIITTSNLQGIKYSANYHAGYTARSLVDKEYVDGVAGRSYTFSNGLTESLGTVKLGGTIIENTTISTNGNYNFDITTFDGGLYFSKIGDTSGHRLLWNNGGGLWVEQFIDSGFQTYLRGGGGNGQLGIRNGLMFYNKGLGQRMYFDMTLAGPARTQTFQDADGVIQLQGYLGTKLLSATSKNPGLADNDKLLYWNNTNGNYDLKTITNNIATSKIIYVDATLGTDTRTSGDTYYINKPFLTIQAAFNYATTKDIIYVRSGTYNESVVANNVANFWDNLIILENVTWNAVGTASNFKDTSSGSKFRFYLIDSILTNTGDGTDLNTQVDSANIVVKNGSLFLDTNECYDGKHSNFTNNTITISSSLGNNFKNKIISTNAMNLHGSWSSFFQIKNIYLQTSLTNVYNCWVNGGINLEKCYLNSINGHNVSYLENSKNNIFVAKYRNNNLFSNNRTYHENDYFYSELDHNLSYWNPQGSSIPMRYIINCKFNSFKNTIQHGLGSTFYSLLQFTGNTCLVRDSVNYPYCINASVWDVALADGGSYLNLINNISNVPLHNHPFVNQTLCLLDSNNFVSSRISNEFKI